MEQYRFWIIIGFIFTIAMMFLVFFIYRFLIYRKTQKVKIQDLELTETTPTPVPEPTLHQEPEEQRILREEQEKHDRFADHLVNNSEMPPIINPFNQ